MTETTMLPQLNALVSGIQASPVPVFATCEGATACADASIAFACDVVGASPRASARAAPGPHERRRSGGCGGRRQAGARGEALGALPDRLVWEEDPNTAYSPPTSTRKA